MADSRPSKSGLPLAPLLRGPRGRTGKAACSATSQVAFRLKPRNTHAANRAQRNGHSTRSAKSSAK
eukprot:9207783-Alexandrium_andersonii.AAC.1